MTESTLARIDEAMVDFGSVSGPVTVQLEMTATSDTVNFWHLFEEARQPAWHLHVHWAPKRANPRYVRARWLRAQRKTRQAGKAALAEVDRLAALLDIPPEVVRDRPNRTLAPVPGGAKYRRRRR